MGYTPPYLEVRKITGGWQDYSPSSTTGDARTISANSFDTYPKIILDGNSRTYIHLTTGEVLSLLSGAVEYLWMYPNGTQMLLQVKNPDTDLTLEPNGTGLVRFGSYTAGAATDSTGYITIKDSGGTSRKLMVQA